MIDVDKLGPRIIFSFQNGSIQISETTCFAVIIAVVLAILGIWMGSGLKKVPRGKQVIAELFVGWVYKFSESHVGDRYGSGYAPYIGSLMIWLVFANSLGLLGLRPVTADINVTASLSVLSFMLIQGSSLRHLGVEGRIGELGDPYYFILPFNLISEFVLPMTLALRLFGNIFGGMIVVDMWLSLMTRISLAFAPIPILRAVTVIPLNLFFDIFEPLLQAYIFTILTTINLGEGISGMNPETKEKRQKKKRLKIKSG